MKPEIPEKAILERDMEVLANEYRKLQNELEAILRRSDEIGKEYWVKRTQYMNMQSVSFVDAFATGFATWPIPTFLEGKSE